MYYYIWIISLSYSHNSLKISFRLLLIPQNSHVTLTCTSPHFSFFKVAKDHHLQGKIQKGRREGSTVSHFNYAPLKQCKISQKRNMIFLFWDYQRIAHLYLHYPLQFHCDQTRNEWENGSWRALPSKHHFTLHYFEWNSVRIALNQGRISQLCQRYQPIYS